MHFFINYDQYAQINQTCKNIDYRIWDYITPPEYNPFEFASETTKNLYYYEEPCSMTQSMIDQQIKLDTSDLKGCNASVNSTQYNILRSLCDYVIQDFLKYDMFKNYELKQYDILKASVYQLTNYKISLILCICRPGKAYGKVIEMDVYVDSSKKIYYKKIKVLGMISQDIIEFN